MSCRALGLFATIALAASTSGCKDSPAAGAAHSAPSRAHPEGTASARTRLYPHRPLLDEASRAELDAGGLLIELGGVDQMKYTRGGWRTGWGATHAGDDRGEIGRAELDGRRTWLDVVVPAPVAEIVVRGRSATAGQAVTFYAGDTELGTAKLGGDWAVHRIALEAGTLPAGPTRLELRSATSGSPRAELDWLWLAREAGVPEPVRVPRVAPMTVAGGARRALIAPDARTYSFYLQPPGGAHLVVDLGAAERATFAITATADGGEPVVLAEEQVEGRWMEREVSLATFAGKAVRIDLTTRDQRGAVGWGEPEILVEAAPPAPRPAGARPRNVVLLVIDTARADVFGPFANPDRVVRTPSFDALAEQATVFTAAYDNENWTKPSVATTLSGLYPTTHDTKEDASELPRDVVLLPEHLKKLGFATAGFVANGYISGKFGFEQGWGEFVNYIRENKTSGARLVFADALAWLEKHAKQKPDQPFFLYIQTIDPHVTYEVGEQYWRPYYEGTYRGPLGPSISAEDQVALSKKKFPQSDENVGWLRALYWGEVAYHDDHMGRFFAELDRLGLRDDTLVVVTNDHGEELGERGHFGHGHQIYEEMIRAPLLMSHAGTFPAGQRIDEIVEHVDLAPTILDALGVDPLADADGASMLPLVRGLPFQRPRYAIVEFLHGRRTVRVGSLKLTTRTDGRTELYDLAADPGEERPLGDTAPIALRLCQIHLGEGLGAPDKKLRAQGIAGRRQFRAGKATISPQVRRQLEALGYFGSTPTEDSDDEADK